MNSNDILQPASPETMADISTKQRQPPSRVCERMIRLVADVLSNCRNRELRNELELLQDNLAPAARELDKWVYAYRSYGTQPEHDIAGLTELHDEILEGDEEIAAYLVRTVQSYVRWCDDQLGKCVPTDSDMTRSLQRGFVREDLRKLSKTLGELQGMWSTTIKNRKRVEGRQGVKRKYADLTSTESQPPIQRTREPNHSMKWQVDVVEGDSSDESPHVARCTTHSEHHIQEPQRRKHSKKDGILPVDAELASHVAESILRAAGKHARLPNLNGGLEDVLPKRIRKAEIPDGMTMATIQDAAVQKAQDWWNARS